MEKENKIQIDCAPSTFTSPVDIICAFHGQYAKVNVVLDSIFRLTRSNYYKVIIVDDASPNENFIKLIERNAAKNASRKKIENNIKTVRLDAQVGFGAAMKAGFDVSENPYVCFMHSDCKIENINWLRSLGECLLKHKPQNVRLVSPMADNAVGGHPAQTYNNKIVEDCILENDDFLTMYCFLCHRELFSRCGGFIKSYPYGYYEDQEFAARMQHHGFKQAVCGSSWIHHDGELTIKTLWKSNPKIKTIMEEENRERCIADMKTLR